MNGWFPPSCMNLPITTKRLIYGTGVVDDIKFLSLHLEIWEE